MRYLIIVIGFVLLMCQKVNAAFVEGLEDFPIPEGLEQIENASLNFGNEDIRLVEIYMTSTIMKFDVVVSFYKDTLPQLGWKITDIDDEKAVFEREGEKVEITKESLNPLIVNLVLKSKK